MRVVLDTNILVSALIAPAGYPATIYNAWEYDRFTLLTCPEHIAEVRATLRKPRIAALIEPYKAGRLINQIKKLAGNIATLPQVRRSALGCSERFVNKTDENSDDRPLDEVSHSLHQSEFQPDVQVYVVVQHKCANHEKAKENAEARTLHNARSALMDHRENDGDDQDRH